MFILLMFIVVFGFLQCQTSECLAMSSFAYAQSGHVNYEVCWLRHFRTIAFQRQVVNGV